MRNMISGWACFALLSGCFSTVADEQIVPDPAVAESSSGPASPAESDGAHSSPVTAEGSGNPVGAAGVPQASNSSAPLSVEAPAIEASAGEAGGVVEAASAPSVSGATREPISLAWVRTDVSDDVHDLRAAVEQRVPLSVPIHWTLSVPKGYVLLSGASSGQLSGARAQVHHLAFQLRGQDEEPVLLTIDASGSGWGVHGELPYGGAEPVPAQIERKGPRVVIGGRDLGSAVQGE